MNDQMTTADFIKICKAYQQLGQANQSTLDHLIKFPEQIADQDEGAIEAIYNFLLNAPADYNGFYCSDSEEILDRMDAVLHPDDDPEDYDPDEVDPCDEEDMMTLYRQLADDR